jgi:hypothetical protein
MYKLAKIMNTITNITAGFFLTAFHKDELIPWNFMPSPSLHAVTHPALRY